MKKVLLGLLFASCMMQADIMSEELTVEKAERIITTFKDRVVGTLHIGELYVYIRALMTLYAQDKSGDPAEVVTVMTKSLPEGE